MVKSSQDRRRSMLALCAAVAFAAAGISRLTGARADDAPAPPAKASVNDVAEKMSTLVESGKIDELARLDTSNTGTQNFVKLSHWKTEYVNDIKRSDQERQGQFDKAVTKIHELMDKQRYDEAIANAYVAFEIAKDKNAFLQIRWVKDLTVKAADLAKKYEDQGRWLESYQIYSDLNSLYEIDTRYKPDMQRLARRTRLLALYSPKALYDMRKALTDQHAAETQPGNAGTQPAPGGTALTQPDESPFVLSNFPRWQDVVDGSDRDMMHQAIEQAKNNWVEQIDYETLLHGGVDGLRLFLTTAQLQKDFPALGDAGARTAFGQELDAALAQIDPSRPLTESQMESITDEILDVNAKTVKLPEQVAVMEFTDGAMEKIDPFSSVIWPHDVDEFEKNTRGNFGGVGIQIALDNGQLKVISPLEDTPAFKAGIEAGDVVVAIDGKTTVGITIDQAVHQIMGPANTKVTLRVKRLGRKDPIDFPLTRGIIEVTSVKGFQREPDGTSWDFMVDTDSKIGYVRITGFQEKTPDELRDAVKKLQDAGMRGIVLDLRFNPGGLLKSAVDMVDMFVDHGTILSTRGRRTQPSKWSAKDDAVLNTNVPMIVLVNQHSASASEIFSGAMKDLHRGLIVGERSFGKGCVENLIPLGEKAMMKLTMSYYYLPNGENLHRRDGSVDWGVEPDVTVQLTPEQLKNLLEDRRSSEIIHAKDAPAATQPVTQPGASGSSDTQLETALFLMRLQLLQQQGGA